jgi:hypothetical protein
MKPESYSLKNTLIGNALFKKMGIPALAVLETTKHKPLLEKTGAKAPEGAA